MAAYLYFPVYILSMSVIALFYGAQYLSSGDYRIQEKGNNGIIIPLLISLLLIFWLGNRPISSVFGDTYNYGRTYELLKYGVVTVNWNEEWFWSWITQFCHNSGLTVNEYFTVIDAGYFLAVLFAIKILMPNNIILGLLFALCSFSFFTFGVNGIRNGLAIHLTLLGFALYLKGIKSVAVLLFMASFGIHRSVALPIASFFASIYVLKDIKITIYIWIASIFLSLVSGNYFTNLFAGFGLDERMEQYLNTENLSTYSTTTSAFRWDFLLYSSMPVLMAWIVCIKEEVTDNWFNVLAKTYCLCNTFWILVIRASFSNRFAYLSWFLYPIIIAYPLIMLPVWKDQDNKTGSILYGYVFLTLGICYATGMIRF